MNFKHIQTHLLICSLLAVFQPLSGIAQQNSEPSKTGATAQRDGQHDFDFEVGSWKIHLKRLDGRLVGSKKWVEFDGTSVTRRVWDGRSQLEEFETDSPAGGHIEGLTLRLYDPQTYQWSLYWATSKSGVMGVPTIGESVPGYEAGGWTGIGAPANTPPEIVAILNQQVNAALAGATFKAQLAKLGLEPFASTPAEFGKFIAEYTEKWGKIIRAAGIKAE